VVVAGRAREGKVVGHQCAKWAPVLLLHFPHLVPLPDDFFGCRVSIPLLRLRSPSPRMPALQPVRKLPLRATPAVILRSSSGPSSFPVPLVSGLGLPEYYVWRPWSGLPKLSCHARATSVDWQPEMHLWKSLEGQVHTKLQHPR
jgi:hypothetical protein